MEYPVRVVCVECLESLDVSSTSERSGRASCPHCGCPVDLDRIGFGSCQFDTNGSATTEITSSSTRLPIPAQNDVPKSIGRFVLKKRLGEGGYGQVYQAYDPHLDREVALKILKPNRLGEKSLERFFREARAAARLDHPNIVALHDAGRDDGRCWIAYQLVPGRTLSAVRDLDRPTFTQSVQIVRELSMALDHAHGRGVFHRDLKPANVLIDDNGRARLTDFGLARRNDLDSDLTTEGTVLGTPQYMSPEAAAGKAHEADARSDVYSLGVILYELICGKKPSNLPSGSLHWMTSKSQTMPTPRSIDRKIPVELDRICMKSLAYEPADRFENARLLADALGRCLNRLHPEGRPRFDLHEAKDLRKRSHRRFRAWIFGSTLLAGVALVPLVYPWKFAGPATSAATLSTALPVEHATSLRDPAPEPLVPAVLPQNPTAEPSAPDVTREAFREVKTPSDVVAKVRHVVGSRKKYHRESCRFLPKVNRTDYPTIEAAEALGLKPCEHCRPDVFGPEVAEVDPAP